VTHRIEFTRPAIEHFARLDARRRSRIRDALLSQLVHEPGVETRKRKRLRPNALAKWRLRVGDLRVYYDLTDDTPPVSVIKAIGIKERHRVVIGSEEIDLS
jgi:mRNA-degrading endonuclease RelE of RelBE toxin-antitoxin system